VNFKYPAARKFNCLCFRQDTRCVAISPAWNQASLADQVINSERPIDSEEVTSTIYSGTRQKNFLSLDISTLLLCWYNCIYNII